MILYCDFNPRLVREYKIDDLKNFGINFADSSRYYISGYGIDSLEFTVNLQEKAKIIGFYGGLKGQIIKSDLKKMKCKNTAIKLLDESIEEIILKDKINKTVIRTKSPRITLENIEEFISIFSSEIDKVNLVVLNQTDQINLDPYLYEVLIKICYSRGVNVAVVYDKLQNIKTSKPYIVSFNKETISDYIGLKVKTENEIIIAGKHIIENGVGIAVICDINGFYIFSKDKLLKAEFNDILDYISEFNENLMLAGMATAFEREYDFITSVKLAVASAIAENFIKFRHITMVDIKKLMNKITVNQL